MGLDTTIYADGEPIYYYRKNWELQNWFNKIGEEKYKHLAQRPLTRDELGADWYSDDDVAEINKRRLTEIDFNCIAIPVTEEDWDLFTMAMEVEYKQDYDEMYKECDEAVRAAFKAKKEVAVHGWW
jgi:hypothetical protein